MDRPSETPKEPIVVHFDGPCLLCDGFVRFAARHDPDDRLRFVPLGSAPSLALLGGEGRGSQTVIVTQGERRFVRSDAVLRVLGALSFPWRLGALFRVVPRVYRDRLYDVVAAHRNRLFGRAEACPMPSAELRRKRLD